MRGYIAMLAVKKEYRGKGIATRLVRMAIDIMIDRDADEVSSTTHVPTPEVNLKSVRSLWKPKSPTLRR